MKKTPALVLTALMGALSFTACKKDKGVNENLDPNNQEQYDFTTTKEGSYWKIGMRGEGIGTRHATGRDSVVDGFNYSYYERMVDGSDHITPEYFGKNSGFYYTLIDLDGTETNYVSYAFYKDSAALGDSWANTANITAPVVGSVNVRTESEVVETGLTMSWGGKTFENVVHVRTKLLGKVVTWVDVGKVDVWFVRHIGVIREQADINIMSVYTRNYVDSVVDYHLVY